MLTSFGGSTVVSEPRFDNPAATPCGSVLIVELQPSLKVVGRTNVGGSSCGAEAGTICETQLVSEPAENLLPPILIIASEGSSGSSLGDILPVREAGSSAPCVALEIVDPVFPPLPVDGTFVLGLTGGCKHGFTSPQDGFSYPQVCPSNPCYSSSTGDVLGGYGFALTALDAMDLRCDGG